MPTMWCAADDMPAVAGPTRRRWLGGGSRRSMPVQDEVGGGGNDDVDGRMPRGLGYSEGVDDPCRSKVE